MAKYFETTTPNQTVQIDATDQRLTLIKHFTMDTAISSGYATVVENDGYTEEVRESMVEEVQNEQLKYVFSAMLRLSIPKTDEMVISAIRYDGVLGDLYTLRTWVDFNRNVVWVDTWATYWGDTENIEQGGVWAIDFSKVHIYIFGYPTLVSRLNYGLEVYNENQDLIFDSENYPLKVLNSKFFVGLEEYTSSGSLAWGPYLDELTDEYLNQNLDALDFSDKVIACCSANYFSPRIIVPLSLYLRPHIGLYGFAWETENQPTLRACNVSVRTVNLPRAVIEINMRGNAMLIDVTNAPII